MTDSVKPSGTPTRDDDESLDLRKYLQVIAKRKWLIAATVLVGVTLSVLYTLRQTPIYQATASVVVDPSAPQVFGKEVQEVVQLGAGNYWSNQEYYNTQIEIVTSFALARKTVVLNQLQDDPRLVPPRPDKKLSEDKRIDAAADALLAAVSADLKQDSRIVRIHVKHSDKALAAELANKHMTTYRRNNVEVQKVGTDDAAQFLTKELDSAEKELRTSEQDLYEFKKNSDIISVSLEDKMNILASDLAKYNAALSDARIKRIELEGLQKQAKAALTGADILESPIFALGNSSLTAMTLKDQYVKEQQIFIDLKEKLDFKHPNYVSQKKKVDDLYAAIQREARLALAEIEERLLTERNNEARFTAELDRLRQDAFDLGPKTVAYNRLQRKHDSDVENFRIVRDRLRASQLSLKNDVSNNIHEHDRAQVPDAPISPRMSLNVAVALFASLLLGLGLAFGLEQLDRSVKTAEDVEQTIHAPVLGLIPLLADIAKTPEALKERDLYVFNHPGSSAAECCRSIRTNILFSGADKPLKTLTISSPNPREGKTTAAIYLGTTMAQSGHKVLLVDTDMRRPRIHKSMGVSRERGISNLILGDAGFDDCIKSTSIPNLYVLPCGPTPPNPAELLLTNRFKQLLEELEGRFDRIILDSPPLQAVTDAVVLARLTDGAIMISKAGSTSKDDLSRAARMWRDVNAHLVGVVLNDLDLSEKKYGYYYYAYGYGESEAEGSQA